MAFCLCHQLSLNAREKARERLISDLSSSHARVTSGDNWGNPKGREPAGFRLRELSHRRLAQPVCAGVDLKGETWSVRVVTHDGSWCCHSAVQVPRATACKVAINRLTI